MPDASAPGPWSPQNHRTRVWTGNRPHSPGAPRTIPMNCQKGPVFTTESLAHPSIWCAPALPVFTPLHWLHVIYQPALSPDEIDADPTTDATSDECALHLHTS